MQFRGDFTLAVWAWRSAPLYDGDQLIAKEGEFSLRRYQLPTERYDVELHDGRPLRLVIWDTDGDFGESILSSSYVAGASGALVVGDATRPQTLARMALLLDGFERTMPQRPTCAVLNKVDLVAPGEAELKSLGRRNFMQASAQTGRGVREAFLSLAESIQRDRM